MKTLQQFCEEKGLVLVPIRYRHQFGYMKRKGFDICKPNGEILVAFEPIDFSTGKWLLRNTYRGYSGPYYTNRITKKFLSGIDVNGYGIIRNLVVVNRGL
jgi:hypothetical protein